MGHDPLNKYIHTAEKMEKLMSQLDAMQAGMSSMHDHVEGHLQDLDEEFNLAQ